MQQEINPGAETVAALKSALEWCEQDAANQEGFPTQEMLDARVIELKTALAKIGAYPILSAQEASAAAHEWASYINDTDPGLCLYAFASTAKIQSEAHRAECLAHLDGACRHAADANIAAGEYLDSHEELDALRLYLAAAPITQP